MSKDPVSYENLDFFETFWNDIGNIVNADPEDLQSDILAYVKYIRLYKQQVEEQAHGIKAINEYVFHNLTIPKEHRARIQRIIHYTIPVALETLGKEQPNE